MHVKTIVLAAALSLAPGLLHAQFEFKLDDRDVQVHSFASEGFAWTNQNNYLTMNTTSGAFFTDFGFNITSNITDKLRVGAQFYDRDIGHLQEWHPVLDWAVVDYRLTDWFGIRAGKVKTALGLYNQTQDQESVQTWALMPQSVYPLDLRSRTLTHTGLDIYGHIGLHKVGSLSYTIYAGKRPNDTRDGLYYAWAAQGYPNNAFSGKTAGTDLRWTPPVSGLMLGGSYAAINDKYQFTDVANGPVPVAGTLNSTTMWTASGYGEYSTGRWRFDAEIRRNLSKYFQVDPDPGQTEPFWYSDRGWFASAVYQLSKHVEVGAYHSRYYFDVHSFPEASTHYIRDSVVTLHYTVNRFMSMKLEGHFMDGTGDPYGSHGFYTVDNPQGLKPTTNMLVVRLGYSL
jgi:hypothetical protein